MSLYCTFNLFCYYINTWQTEDCAELKHVFSFGMLMYLENASKIHSCVVLIYDIQTFELYF